MRGVGWEAHVTSRDPILDAVGTRSCAIRAKDVQCHDYLLEPMNLRKEIRPQRSRRAQLCASGTLVHRLAYNDDVVAFKMGRRQGARRAHI